MTTPVMNPLLLQQAAIDDADDHYLPAPQGLEVFTTNGMYAVKGWPPRMSTGRRFIDWLGLDEDGLELTEGKQWLTVITRSGDRSIILLRFDNGEAYYASVPVLATEDEVVFEFLEGWVNAWQPDVMDAATVRRLPVRVQADEGQDANGYVTGTPYGFTYTSIFGLMRKDALAGYAGGGVTQAKKIAEKELGVPVGRNFGVPETSTEEWLDVTDSYMMARMGNRRGGGGGGSEQIFSLRPGGEADAGGPRERR